MVRKVRGGDRPPEVWPSAGEVWEMAWRVGLRNLADDSRCYAWVDVAHLVVRFDLRLGRWEYDREVLLRSLVSGLRFSRGLGYRRRLELSDAEWRARCREYAGELRESWPGVRDAARSGGRCLGCAGELGPGYLFCGNCVYHGLRWRSSWEDRWAWHPVELPV